MNELLKSVSQYVSGVMKEYDSGHGWSHIERVVRLALYIHSREKKGDRDIIHLGALMHDIGDHKFGVHDGPEEIGRVLGNAGVDDAIIQKVIYINRNISFSKRKEAGEMNDELMIVQDADRLDAMGAIGIARAFNYGGYKGRELYDPEEEYSDPRNFTPADTSSSTVGHFYEKLLILRDLMNTPTGRELAEERHEYMVRYLEQFFRECYPGNMVK